MLTIINVWEKINQSKQMKVSEVNIKTASHTVYWKLHIKQVQNVLVWESQGISYEISKWCSNPLFTINLSWEKNTILWNAFILFLICPRWEIDKNLKQNIRWKKNNGPCSPINTEPVWNSCWNTDETILSSVNDCGFYFRLCIPTEFFRV